MNRMIAATVVVVLASLSVGCASSSQTAPQIDASRDLTEMKERILELQEKAAMADVELERLREEIASLRRQVAEGTAAPAASGAANTVETSRLEPTAVPIGNTGPSQVESSDLDLDLPAEAAAIPTTTPDESESPAMPSAGQLEPVEPAAQALYDRGYTLYHQGKYLDSEASFQRFLQAYPATELSDNAQFWIGESRYARGDIRGALAAFGEVVQKYPQGNKVADSLIKEGDCLEKLGDREGARDRYGEVMRRFPESGAAVMAEDRLAGLD